MIKTLIITVPNRMINAGEYMGNYGFLRSHQEAITARLNLKSAEIWTTYGKGVVEINIRKSGAFGKRNQEELDSALKLGMVLEAEYI
jgi:hypothetical protein